jgi:hypothetical protein
MGLAELKQQRAELPNNIFVNPIGPSSAPLA